MRFTTLLLGTICAPLLLMASAIAASPPIVKTHIPLPETNQPDSLWAASNTQLVYQLDNPLVHPPSCVSCGDPVFTDFRVTFYEVDLRTSGGHLQASQPRPLFTLEKGLHAVLFSVVQGWVVYETYSAAQGPNSGGPWTLIAHNIATGHEVVLDSRDQEGIPSIGAGVLNDDQSIVWATWTEGTDGPTSVIRMYNLVSGKRKLVARGGSPNTWWYTWASISGNRVVYEKASRTYSQILLTDLSAGKTQQLTLASAENSQPSISGDLVAWEDGAQFSQGKGVVVRNLQTGKQVEFHAFDAQGPRALAGRYMVWVHGNRTSEASYYIRLYDRVTGTDRPLFQPNHGWGTGNIMRGSQNTVLYENGKAAQQKWHFVSRLTIVRLP